MLLDRLWFRIRKFIRLRLIHWRKWQDQDHIHMRKLQNLGKRAKYMLVCKEAGKYKSQRLFTSQLHRSFEDIRKRKFQGHEYMERYMVH